MADPILLARHGDIECQLLPALANRHGLITGATGTGKTVSLQIMAEGFSRAGVPVFCADIKGDLSGIAAMGEAKDALVKPGHTTSTRRVPALPSAWMVGWV